MNQEEIKFKGSEEHAMQKEAEEKRWQKECGEKIDYFIEKMNILIADGSKESAETLKNMFLMDNIFQYYVKVNIFAKMYIVMNIYEREDAEGYETTILNKGRTVEELTDYIFQLKMILYRLDFDIGDQAEKELLSFLQLHHTSTVTLELMLTSSVMRPLKLALKLEKIFERANWKEFELSILYFIDQFWKGNYRIYRKLFDYGKMQTSGQLETLIRKDADINLRLQELMWKLNYKEPESEIEIAKYLKDYPIDDDIWRYLLELDGVKEIEYYILIITALIEEGILDKAETALEFLMEKHSWYEPAVSLLENIRRIRNRMGEHV